MSTTQRELEVEASCGLEEARRYALVDAKYAERAQASESLRTYLCTIAEWCAQRQRAPIALARIAEKERTHLECWQRRDRIAHTWQPVLEALIFESETENKSVGRVLHEDESELWFGIAAPIVDDLGVARGGLAAVVIVEPTQLATELDTLASFVACIRGGFCARYGEQASPAKQASESEETQKISRTSRFRNADEFAFHLADELRIRTGSELVSYAKCTRGRVEVVALTGIDEPALDAAGTRALRQAAAESHDARASLVHPPLENSEAVAPLHRQWSSEGGEQWSVLSLPVPQADGAGVIGVFSLRRRAAKPFVLREVEQLSAHVRGLGTSFDLLERAGRGAVKHLLSSAHNGFRAGLRAHKLGKKLLVASILACALYFFFGTMPYRVTVPCRIAADQVFHTSAPFEGRICASDVQAGQALAKGAMLCRLDTTQFELQQEELRAQRDALRLEARQLSTGGDLQQSALAEARAATVEAKLVALASKIEDATLRAPMDCIVLEGDLHKRIGQVVPQGEALFRLVPQGVDYTHLEVEVPEEYASAIALDQIAEFSSNARPEDVLEYRVVRIAPTAEVVRGGTAFFVDARRAGEGERVAWIRAGMQGYARLHLGRDRVCSIALRRVRDSILRALWF